MIKHIIVALDPDEDTPAATRYARDVAARWDAEVSGLAVIDTKGIAREIGPGGAVGAGYYAEVSRHRLMEEARETALALAGRFDVELEDAMIPHTQHVKEGVPFRQVIEETKYTDLLVIGRVPHFFYNKPGYETNTLEQIVKRGLAPTLVVGEKYQPVRRVLVAYDGSAPAARTIQRFAQLRPFGSDLVVHVVHVRAGDSAASRNESELLVKRMAEYLRGHGFDRVDEASVDGGSPATRLNEMASQLRAELIVAGAHAVSAVRRIAFGSTTHALRHESPVSLFLYH